MNKIALLAVVAMVVAAIALTGCAAPAKSPDQEPGAIVGRPGQI